MIVVLFRSVVFNIAFYLVLFVYLIAALPTLLMPRGALLGMVKNWSALNLTMLRVICGLKCEFQRRRENSSRGRVLVASKHQSMWETFALITILKDPAYILKRELMWIPFFGWHARSGEDDPGRSRCALAGARQHDRACERGSRGRPPDHHLSGRDAPRARRRAEIQVRCRVSLQRARHALRAGSAEFGRVLAARVRSCAIPGVVRVEFLDPIAPGLDRQAFFNQLQNDIETATAQLVATAASAHTALYA